MPMSMEEFNALYAAQELRGRVLEQVVRADQVLTPGDVAAHLAARPGRFAALYHAEIRELEPAVRQVLAELAQDGLIRPAGATDSYEAVF
jgi:hypothetical protein